MAPPPSKKPPQQPPRRPPRERRAFAGLRGGPIEERGDPALSRVLASALDVVAGDKPPELTHGFHTWPARFHPLLVRRLLVAHEGARRVLDPFCGSGTTLVEAAIAGRAGIGIDANPLAVMLARFKATPASPARRAALARAAAAVVERVGDEVRASRRRSAVSPPPSHKTRFDDPRFYPPHVYRELIALRLAVDEIAPEADRGDARWLRDALLLVLSSIVVKFSQQRSDTDDRAVERATPRGAPTRLFGDRAAELGERLAAFAAAVPAGTPAPLVALGDARRLARVDSASIDLVITSPPYLGTYDYVAHHARRFGWLGLDPRPMLAAEIGARRDAEQRGPDAALTRWTEDVGAYVHEIARVLTPGGRAFLLVGDSAVGDRAVPGDDALRRAAAAVGLVAVAAASQERPDAFGPYRATRGQLPGGRREHLVALRKNG